MLKYMQSAIVEVNNLQKIYNSDPPIEALKSVSFSVKEGEIFGIIGVNGAGKTTLIRILTTMLHPTAGSTRVFGIDPVKDPELVRSVIGVLPQDSGMYEEFTIRENLAFIGQMQGLKDAQLLDRIREVAAVMELGDRLDDRVSTLSGGLKQRAMLARTLLGDPRILFLDEPTTGLDVLVARKVRQTIRRLGKDKAVFLATHNMMEAYQLCDRIAIINNGEISMIDSPKNIYETYREGDEDFEDVVAKILRIDEKSLKELE